MMKKNARGERRATLFAVGVKGTAVLPPVPVLDWSRREGAGAGSSTSREARSV